jgi:hypothetical protein
MRKSQLELLREAKRGEAKTLEVPGYLGMYHLLLSGGHPDKPPNPTQIELLMAEEELLAYMGIAGGGKTSALCASIWMLLLFRGGYKAFIARRDYNDLKDTTMLRMEEMLDRLPPGTRIERNKEPPEKWWVKSIDGDISQLTFLGLHDKPKSYEYHGGGVDEADEVEKDIMDEMQLRARLPGHACRIILSFNPTDEDHWIYGACTGLNEKGEKILGEDGKPLGPVYRLIRPQPGENNHNLKPGYYESKKRTLSPDVYQRMVEGQWGSSVKGSPVFGKTFKRDFHAKKMLDFNPNAPLVRFHDFGYRHSVCIWAQPTAFGGLDVLWELHGENKEIHEWAPEVLAETRTRFPDAVAVTDWGDPAANQHKDTGSTIAVLNANGITLHFIPNRPGIINDGIRTIRHLLSRQTGGVPVFRIDKRCTIVIRMLEKGYRYPDEKERKGRRADEPLKDGYFDHFADALRYGIHGLFGHQVASVRGPDDQEMDPSSTNTTTATTWAGGFQLQRSIAYAPSFDPQKMRR